MARFIDRSLLFACWVALSTLGACLPTDSRDPPGELILSVTADPALTDGFSTDDGWSIAYTRFLVVMGEVLIMGDGCKRYNEGFYSRILDMSSSEPQRLAVLYGLGPCELSFRISTPNWNTVLGANVSEGDETLLRTAGTDAYSTNQGISAYLEGHAEGPAGERKTFSWSFRSFVEYSRCFEPPDGTPTAAVTLAAEQRLTRDILVRGTAPFQNASRDPVGPLRFEPFREADDQFGNADGAIDLEELGRAPLPPGVSTRPMVQSLADLLYTDLLTDVARYQGSGSCERRVVFERRGFRDED